MLLVDPVLVEGHLVRLRDRCSACRADRGAIRRRMSSTRAHHRDSSRCRRRRASKHPLCPFWIGILVPHDGDATLLDRLDLHSVPDLRGLLGFDDHLRRHLAGGSFRMKPASWLRSSSRTTLRPTRIDWMILYWVSQYSR